MATTDTGPLGTLELVSVTEVDPNSTGTATHLRVVFTLDDSSATEALTGFLIWHDDGAGSTTPVWVNAADASLAGDGDSGTPVKTYKVLITNPLATTGATWWETFEEYANGNVAVMDQGGAAWAGGFVI